MGWSGVHSLLHRNVRWPLKSRCKGEDHDTQANRLRLFRVGGGVAVAAVVFSGVLTTRPPRPTISLDMVTTARLLRRHSRRQRLGARREYWRAQRDVVGQIDNCYVSHGQHLHPPPTALFH